MRTLERIYRRTQAGQDALASGNIGIAGGEYHRVLTLISSDTHFDVVRSSFVHYHESLVRRWLTDLERRGLLESCAAAAEQDLDFT